MSDARQDDARPEDEVAQDREAAAEAPLNGGSHSEAGSYTSTKEDGAGYDGAFTDSDIPDQDVKPGETEADKAGFEGSYTDSDGVD